VRIQALEGRTERTGKAPGFPIFAQQMVQKTGILLILK
jgi:hypothetical protein